MDPTVRAHIQPGLQVAVVQKQDQATGTLTEGIVLNILTSSPTHHRGIKVRLVGGVIGRIQVIYSS